jgi:hypothetical protein
MANELNRQFSKEEMQLSNKNIKKHSTSLGIKEMQITATVRVHPIPVRTAVRENKHHRMLGMM